MFSTAPVQYILSVLHTLLFFRYIDSNVYLFNFAINRFGTEIMYMIGHRPHWFWKICWKFLAPLTIVTLLIGIVVMKFSNPITYKAYNAATVSNHMKCRLSS